jgi:phosphoribosylaminoimidazolecarboxamide formyltransferase/IMP cyclohydrolase
VPTALFSLSDKTGLPDFAHVLHELGWDFLASGGTARTLRQAGLPVTDVADYTGSPEILMGRVKTLHPAVSGGILARDTQDDGEDLNRIGARPIDLVACNLYPFTETVAKEGTALDDAIEKIDIGGVTLIRAAAKNFARVTVLTDKADYADVLTELQKDDETNLALRRRLAEKAFAHTQAYDQAIAAYLSGDQSLQLQLYPLQTLRYGENWHQQAVLYGYEPGDGPLGGKLLQGKQLSYNNLLDLDGAWRAAVSFDAPAAVVVKHVSPCGIATAPQVEQAIGPAIASYPVSAFGSAIASNRPVNAAFVEQIGDLFVECIVSPGFTPAARQLLADKKNVRLLEMPDTDIQPLHEWRSIVRGALRQQVDLGDPPDAPDWQVVTRCKPDEAEMQALRFAWQAVQPVKSNAVLLARSEADMVFTVGIGGGQPNRVDCVRIAGQRAGERATGSVLASDAFFPFPDGVQVAADLGVTALIQPGGSQGDAEVIAAADQLGLAMVFTGVRHFRH